MPCVLGAMATEATSIFLAGSKWQVCRLPTLEAGHCDSAGRTLTTEISFYIRRE